MWFPETDRLLQELVRSRNTYREHRPEAGFASPMDPGDVGPLPGRLAGNKLCSAVTASAARIVFDEYTMSLIRRCRSLSDTALISSTNDSISEAVSSSSASAFTVFALATGAEPAPNSRKTTAQSNNASYSHATFSRRPVWGRGCWCHR